jgi:TPR repeat protein
VEGGLPTSNAESVAAPLREAYQLWRGTGGRMDFKQASKLVATVVRETSDPVAQLFRARIDCFPTHDAFPPTDFRRINQVALKVLPQVREKADGGDVLATYLVGFCLQQGVGVVQDTTAGLALLEKAANADLTVAQVAMGQAAERLKNYRDARQWYERAATAGDFQAEICIGDFYQYGNSVPKDMNEALRWMERAANRGNAYNQFLVGYWLNNGTDGIKVDKIKAMEWFRKAAENGYADAKRMLAKPEPAELGIPAKELDVKQWMKGTTVTLASEHGKVHVVEFWATWCPPCRASIPHLTELAKKYKDVIFCGISDEDADTVERFVKQQGDKMDYHVGIDNERKTNAAYMTVFQQNGIPTAFIVDKQGRVVWHGHPMVGLEEALAEVVSGKFNLEAAKKAEIAEAMMGKYKQLAQQKGDAQSARQLGEDVLKNAGPKWTVLNELSWFILTNPEVENRDLELALRLAKKGCETSNWKNAMVLDTYARALFDSGIVKEAIQRERQAVKLATSPTDKLEMQTALDRYTGKQTPAKRE